MAIASAIAEVAEEKGMEPYSNRMTEGWLLFQPWIRHDEEDETGVNQRIAVYEAYQKELRYDHPEGNTLEPTDLELLEIGVLREQWDEFLALQEKQYKDRTAITKSSTED
jgi:hypothetical protein